jgi:hypothetical protein
MTGGCCCLVSDTLEEGITPHKAPRVLQTLLWISTIAAGTPHQLIFAGEAPIPMGQLPWGGAGSHPERSFWGSKGSMPLYAAMESYAAQMRVILPSISAPFGLPQPNVTVRAKKILLSPTGVKGWAGGESLTARAWRQAPDLVPNSSYCGHVVVANGAEQSAQSFTLQLGGSFPVNSTWWSMRVVRMFEADYAITVSSSGTFSDYIDAAATHVYQIGDCGDKEPPPPPAVCTPSPVALGCYNVSGLWCYNDTRTSAGWRHDPNRGCVLGKSASHVHPVLLSIASSLTCACIGCRFGRRLRQGQEALAGAVCRAVQPLAARAEGQSRGVASARCLGWQGMLLWRPSTARPRDCQGSCSPTRGVRAGVV